MFTRSCAVCVTILVVAVNSVQIYRVTCSYSSRLFLCALDTHRSGRTTTLPLSSLTNELLDLPPVSTGREDKPVTMVMVTKSCSVVSVYFNSDKLCSWQCLYYYGAYFWGRKLQSFVASFLCKIGGCGIFWQQHQWAIRKSFLHEKLTGLSRKPRTMLPRL